MSKLASEIVKSTDEEEVRSYAADYVELMNKYKAEVTDPLVAELEHLPHHFYKSSIHGVVF